jgi:hypothetical protein
MAVTLISQKQLSANSWSITFDSSLPNPTFYIYQNGLLLQTTQAKTATFNVSAGAKLLVEILDDANQRPSFVYSGVALLGWYATANTASYRIEEWTGSAWVVIDTLPDIGSWWLSWTTPYLPDCQSYQFRITPLGKNGNAGTPKIFAGFMVRIPDAPSNTFTLNTDSTVTIN